MATRIPKQVETGIRARLPVIAGTDETNNQETGIMRYVYGMFPTREQAEDFLSDMFNTGDVLASERPRIEKRGSNYAITLPCGE